MSPDAQAGRAEEGARQGSPGPADGEALLHVEGHGDPIHWNFLRGELPKQCHLGQRVGHLAGKQDRLMAAPLDRLIIILSGPKELLWVWEGRREREE